MFERIKSIRKESGLSQVDFAKAIGLKRGLYSMIELGKSHPGIDTLILIANKFGKSYEWLLEGKITDKEMGSNLGSNVGPNSEKEPEKPEPKENSNLPVAKKISSLSEPNDSYPRIPLIPTDAIAGWGTGDFSVLDINLDRYVVPDFEKVDFLIRIKGTSMYPKYNSGDIVACRYVKESLFIQWGKVYVLDSTQGAIVKRLFPSQDPDSIECRSDNEAFPPFPIPKDEIRAMALVVGIIRLE